MSRFLCVSGCAVKLTMLFCVSDSRCNTVNQPLSLPVTKTLTQAHWGSVIFQSEEDMGPSLSTNVEQGTLVFIL